MKITCLIALSSSAQRNLIVAGEDARKYRSLDIDVPAGDTLLSHADVTRDGALVLRVATSSTYNHDSQHADPWPGAAHYARTCELAPLSAPTLDAIRQHYAAVDAAAAARAAQDKAEADKKAAENTASAARTAAALAAFRADTSARGMTAYGSVTIDARTYYCPESSDLHTLVRARNEADLSAAAVAAAEEKADWIAAHGSAALRAGVAHGLPCGDTYTREREDWLDAEQLRAYPDALPRSHANPDKDQPLKCASLEQLARFDALTAANPDLSLKLRWLKWNGEYINAHVSDCEEDCDCPRSELKHTEDCYSSCNCCTARGPVQAAAHAVAEHPFFGALRWPL